MAEYVMPPEMEDFMEAAGDVAMDNFDPAAFEADPSAAFSDTMGAVMDFMGDAGMPPDMMDGFNDIATGVFDQYMGDNPDAAPMEAFDAVGAGIDHQMADMAPDMPAADMAGEMPPPPEDFGAFIDECPPCGSFEGGEGYDAAAHPHEGGMADMMDTYGPPPGDMAGPGPDAGGPPPGDMAGEPPMGDDFGGDGPGGAQPGDAAMGEPGPMDGGPGGPGDMGSPMGEPGPMDGGPGGADPLFGEAGPAGGPPPGDMPPGDPAMGEPGPMDGGPGGPGDMAPPMDDMGAAQSHMDDAAAHGPQDPGPGTPEPMAGDMDGDGMMPPPPTDDPVDDGMG